MLELLACFSAPPFLRWLQPMLYKDPKAKDLKLKISSYRSFAKVLKLKPKIPKLKILKLKITS